jgi:hypothetical protein
MSSRISNTDNEHPDNEPRLRPSSARMPARIALHRAKDGSPRLRLQPDLTVSFPAKEALKQRSPRFVRRGLAASAATAAIAASVAFILFAPQTATEQSAQPTPHIQLASVLIETGPTPTVQPHHTKAEAAADEEVPSLHVPEAITFDAGAQIDQVLEPQKGVDAKSSDALRTKILKAYIIQEALAAVQKQEATVSPSHPGLQTQSLEKVTQERHSEYIMPERTRAGRLLHAAWFDVARAIHRKSGGRVGAGWPVNKEFDAVASLN